MSCFYTNRIFHWRKQTLGSLLPKFQLLATNHCQSPTLPPTIPATDYTTKMPAPSSQSWGNADSFCQTLNKLKAPPWMHKRERKTKQKKILPAQFPRKRMLSVKRDACPHTAHHPLTLHHLTATPVISVTELICWFLPQGRQKFKQPLSEIREQRHTKITWIW